jgi:hypothetical protein
MDGDFSSRQQRRRAARKRRPPTFDDFHAAGGGVFTISVLTPPELFGICAGNLSLARSLADWVERIPRTRPLCLTCDHEFTLDLAPTLWVLTMPCRADAEVVMLSGICSECCDRYASSSALIAAAADQLKHGLWPDLRVLDPVHFSAGGRA